LASHRSVLCHRAPSADNASRNGPAGGAIKHEPTRANEHPDYVLEIIESFRFVESRSARVVDRVASSGARSSVRIREIRVRCGIAPADARCGHMKAACVGAD
jgi:hypothetical protein